MTETKRQGGQVKEGKWLVLTKSKGKSGKGFVHSCGTEIQGKLVAHSIHDGPFALSGSGRVHNEMTPFCPECETEPGYHGMPLSRDPADVHDMEIIRRMADKW